MTRSDVVRRTLAVALLSLAAASVYIRLFGAAPVLGRLFPAVVLCCVGYVIGTAGGQRIQRGLGALLSLVATIIATVILGAMTIPNEQGLVTVGSAMQGAIRGLGIILGSVVPAPVNAETITFGILLTAYGALVGCLLVTTYVPASSIVPPILVFIAGLALSQGSTMSAVPFAAVFVATLIVALALMPAARQQNKIEDGAEFATVEKVARPGRAMRVFVVGAGALAIAAAATIIGPATGIGSIRTAYDPHRKENFRPDTDLDGDDIVTLATKYQTVQRERPREMFTVTGPVIPRAVNWAINAKFNGFEWSSLQTFDQVPPTGIGYVGAQERFTVTGNTGFTTTENLPGPWLPATYRPTNVTGVPARADEEATIVAGDDKAAGKTYATDFRALAMRSLAPLQTVGPVEQPEYGTLRELPRDFPLELRYFAASAMSTATTPYDKLEALASALSSAPFVENDQAVRSSLDMNSLRDVVINSKSGTQAQYATAFALMARSQGFPTRMVVGYAVKGKGDVRRVMSTDVLVYPEVQLTKVGWVPFAPGPQDLARGVPVIRRVKVQPPPEPEPSPKPSKVKPSKEATPTPEPKPQPPDNTSGSDPLRFLVPLLIVLALVAWPLLVAWRRRRVRAAYQRGSPDQQVVGAWSYVRACRRRLGRPLADTASPAFYAADQESPARLRSLAALAEIAMYAPESLGPAQAQQAWEDADAVVADTLRSGSFARRLRWRLVPVLRGPRAAVEQQRELVGV